MIDGDHEERPELAFAPVHLRQIAFVQEAQDELLREVLRILWFVTSLPYVSVERIPLGSAKFLQRLAAARCGAVGRIQHNAPMGRGKPSGLFCPGSSHRSPGLLNQRTSSLASENPGRYCGAAVASQPSNPLRRRATAPCSTPVHSCLR